MKLGLQIILAVMSIIPIRYGLGNMIGGAATFLPPEHVTAALDSQFRFQSAFYFGLALIIWWMIPNIERHTGLFRILIGAIFLGGLARAYSYFTIGMPPPTMFGGMILELVLPVLILWQAKIAKASPQ